LLVGLLRSEIPSPLSLHPPKEWEHSMPRRSAQLPSISAKVRRATNAQNRAEIELGELEREI